MLRICAVLLLAIAMGCRGETFVPRLSPLPDEPRLDPFASDRFGELAWRRFARQFRDNRDLQPQRLRHVAVLVMTPRYGSVEQIRHGNMGHVAIEIDGRLYDMARSTATPTSSAQRGRCGSGISPAPTLRWPQ